MEFTEVKISTLFKADKTATYQFTMTDLGIDIVTTQNTLWMVDKEGIAKKWLTSESYNLLAELQKIREYLSKV